MRDGHFHLDASAVSRAKGQSAVASAAYNANQHLTHRGQKLCTLSADHGKHLNKGIVSDALRRELQESTLFTIEEEALPALDGEEISATLRERFEAEGEALSGHCQIWRGTEYLTLRDHDNKLTYHLRPTAAGLTISRYHGITLSKQATASKEKRHNWTITDGETVFRVRQGAERVTHPDTGKRHYTGVKWLDVYGDKTHDYRDKGDVVETWVQAPEKAPEWVQTLADKDGPITPSERQQLWQTAEDMETDRNSRPARKIEVALLRELSDAQNKEALRAFVDAHLTSKGAIVDIAIHRKQASDGKPNTHAHILFFTRTLTPDGHFSQKKHEQWDWDDKKRIHEWRSGWESALNKALTDAGIDDVRVSKDSYRNRGIDKEPGDHLGPQQWAMEQKGQETRKGEKNRDKKQHNVVHATAQSITQEELNPWAQSEAMESGNPFTVQVADAASATAGTSQPHRPPQAGGVQPDLVREPQQGRFTDFARAMLDRTVQAGIRLAGRMRDTAGRFGLFGRLLRSPALAHGQETRTGPESPTGYRAILHQRRQQNTDYER